MACPLLLLVSVLALDLAGATPRDLRPRIEPLRVDAPPDVDGRLDEPAWARAPVSDAFTQYEPSPGRPPTEPTRFRVLYDDHAVYVGIECEQRTVPVSRRLTRRDREIDTDQISVDLDTRGDGSSAFHFQVTAAGVLIDGVRYDDTSYSTSWDETWEARSATSASGWSTELRIPLRVLRFAPGRPQTWGLQVRRYTSARQELVTWAYTPPTVAGEVSHYGRLGPLVGLPPGGGLELRPFAAAWARRRDPDGGVLARGWDSRGQVGLDAKWRIGQDLTLDLAIAPDFGQVEADTVVLNLGTYETLYEEKRPFFLEGLDVLSTPIQLVYTRRIGSVPETPAIRDDARHRERLVDTPEPSSLWGAGKLVGRIAPRLTVGLLTALAGPNEVEVQGASGRRVDRLVTPATLFQVARLKREIGDNAHLGLLAGATLRLDGATPPVVSAPSDPVVRRLCPDGSQVADGGDCFRDAFVAGVDGRVRSGEWVAQGQLVASLVRGGTSATLPDGTVVSSGDASPGAMLQVGKEGGRHWVGFVRYDGLGRRLVLDDLGYLERPNLHRLQAIATYQELEPTGPFLFAGSNLELSASWNLDGLHGARGLAWNFWSKLAGNRTFVFAEAHVRPAWFDDREVGDGTALEREGLVGGEVWVESATTRPVAIAGGATTQRLWNGYLVELELGLVLRPVSPLELRITPTALFTDGEPRWVDQRDDGRSVFGRQRARQASVLLQGTWTFTPRLTLQLYGQLFVAAVHYHDFLEAPGAGRQIELDELAPADAPAAEPDFQDVALNVSAVLRWEWSLGAVAWLVYSRAQTASPDLEGRGAPTLDPTPLRRGRAVDAFLFKLSWWWGDA